MFLKSHSFKPSVSILSVTNSPKIHCQSTQSFLPPPGERKIWHQTIKTHIGLCDVLSTTLVWLTVSFK